MGGPDTHTRAPTVKTREDGNESVGLKPRYEIRDISKYFSDFSIRSGTRGAFSRDRASRVREERAILLSFSFFAGESAAFDDTTRGAVR